MSFEYTPGYTSAEAIFDGIKAALEDIATPAWTFVREAGSGSFTTPTGSEASAGRYFVFKTKLAHNTGGTGNGEYAYLIVEEDLANTRIIFRTCASFTSGGTSVDVTPLADVIALSLFATDFTSQNAVAVSGDTKSFSIAVETSGTLAVVVLFSIKSPLGTTEQNKHVGLFKVGETEAWILPATAYTGRVKQLNKLATEAIPNPQPQNNIDGGPFETLAPFSIGDSSEFLGLTRGLYYSSGTNPENFDIIELFESSVILRVYQTLDGFIGVES